MLSKVIRNNDIELVWPLQFSLLEMLIIIGRQYIFRNRCKHLFVVPFVSTSAQSYSIRFYSVANDPARN